MLYHFSGKSQKLAILKDLVSGLAVAVKQARAEDLALVPKTGRVATPTMAPAAIRVLWHHNMEAGKIVFQLLSGCNFIIHCQTFHDLFTITFTNS